jgi:hypothetical protein
VEALEVLSEFSHDFDELLVSERKILQAQRLQLRCSQDHAKVFPADARSSLEDFEVLEAIEEQTQVTRKTKYFNFQFSQLMLQTGLEDVSIGKPGASERL